MANAVPIVLVEDDAEVAAFTRTIIESLGHRVVGVFQTGESTLESPALSEARLVLMDIELPGALDGIETARHLQDAHDLPIIYLTSYTDQTRLQRATRTDPYAYLVKPLQPDALAVAIELAFYRHGQEQARRQLQAEIEHQNAMLEAVNKSLASRNADLRTFAYSVSHDLRAPLRGLRGYTHELLEQEHEGLDERARFCLARIGSSAQDLSRLLDDLLRYARADAALPSPEQVDLAALVEKYRSEHQDLIDTTRTRILVDIPAGTRLYIPYTAISQIVANLLENAIKYSRDAERPEVRIDWRPLDEGGQLEVSDNGIGFEMQQHDRIFELFHRLVRADEYEGTGAGLAITKKLVELHNGRIWAESEPGRGARFFIYFPVAAPDNTRDGLSRG